MIKNGSNISPDDERIKALRADLVRCLKVVDELKLRGVASHLDYTITRLDALIAGAPAIADEIDPVLLESLRAESERR